MLPNKAESVVSKSEQVSVEEGVKNLDETEYRNLLENATLPTYASGVKKDANCNDAFLANGISPLSPTTGHYLTTLRREADASQTAADAESERAQEALCYVSSSRTHPRTKLSKCASQDSTMSGIYGRSGALHTRTRSGPAVGVDEPIDMFRQVNARNTAEVRIAIPEPDLPFIDHDQDDVRQEQHDHRAWQRLVNGQQPVMKKVKNVEPANQEVELQPLLDSQQGSPVADDDNESTGEPAGMGRFHLRGKMGSYDVTNNIVNDSGYTKSSEVQPFLFDQHKPQNQQFVTSNRVGGLHSPPTEREMTVSGRGGGMHYGTNRSQTQRGVRPARPDFNQRKKNRDGNVKEVLRADQIPGHMGGLPLDELVTLIEGPKPAGGKKKGSLPDTTTTGGSGKKSSRSGDSSQSLDEQALGASDDADGEDSEETEQWVSADEGPVSESAESPKSEPKTFSLDLNDSRLYRADDESFPTTPTPTADDAEFIPVQTKKKHHKDKQQTQQREHKLTSRRSYDSQQRATTPPPSSGSRSQQISPGGSMAGSQKGANKPPVYPVTNQRARRNSANQVKVDTDEQQEDNDVIAAQSRRPPQPSPKAPSEPDRSRRMSDANLSQNARPSYSAIAGRPRRPPTASFGDFIDDSAMKRTPRNAASLHTSRCGSPDHHRHGHTTRQTAAASNQANASSPDLFIYRTAPSSHGHHGAMAKALLSPPLPPSMHKADGLELEDPPLSVDEGSIASAVPPVWQGPSWADIAKSRSPTSSSQQPSPSPRGASSDEARPAATSAGPTGGLPSGGGGSGGHLPASEVVSLDATIVAAHQTASPSPAAASSTAPLGTDTDDLPPSDVAAVPISLSSPSATASVSATLETPMAGGQSTLCAVHEETIGELQDEQEHAGQHVNDDDDRFVDGDDVDVAAMSSADRCDIPSVKAGDSSTRRTADPALGHYHHSHAARFDGHRGGGGAPTQQRRDIRDSASFVILPGEESSQQQPQLDISFFYEPPAAEQQDEEAEGMGDDEEQLENGERTPTGEEEDEEYERPAAVSAVDGALRLSFGGRTLTFFEPSQPIVEIAKLPHHHSRMAVDVAKQWKEFVQGAAPTRYKDVVSSRRQSTATTGH